MQLIQARFVDDSFAPALKKEIVRKLARVIRARKRPCESANPSSQTPSGVEGAPTGRA